MKILAVCNTPYQIMCVVNLRLNKFVDDDMDIIISDHMMRVESLEESIRETALFGNVYVVKSFNYCRRREQYSSLRYRIGFGNVILREFLQVDKVYDVLLLNNIDPFADRLYERCFRLNKNIRVYGFEDGYGTYVYFNDAVKRLKYNQENRRVLRLLQLLGRKYAGLHIDKMFLFEPEKITWELDAQLERMPLMGLDDKLLRDTLNTIFHYEQMEDRYEKKYIFFEESYRREGMVLPDVLLLELIASWVGKENIMVKVHPRSGNGLFAEMGYATNDDTIIPWELVWMNEKDMAEKVLISISSGSVSTPKSIFGADVRTILLYDLLYGIGSDNLKQYHRWLDDNICEVWPENFFVPKTIHELKNILEKKVCI